MSKIVLYDNSKTYVLANGALATVELMKKEYPAIESYPFIIQTDNKEESLLSIWPLSAARAIYKIDASLTDEEAIAAIEEIINTPQETETTAEERIASALEFQIAMAL